MLKYLLKHKKMNKENKIKELIKKYVYSSKSCMFVFDTPRRITSSVCCKESSLQFNNIFYVFMPEYNAFNFIF